MLRYTPDIVRRLERGSHRPIGLTTFLVTTGKVMNMAELAKGRLPFPASLFPFGYNSELASVFPEHMSQDNVSVLKVLSWKSFADSEFF